ncbi:bifunctional UDP-N-acetylglucosamine diphosphorylase/glucosamine-1-phosphate N-acetyltransferase GlmU [Desulfohalovibrio reitneri]|uniref:bifunctional UDP-N-acetylglucosamine diphosphorylase/glucosamine-1-phosphate N-acetyltransferase GlmU n=1 Tax=Desulfohalovibrio reitneri TaxID=1307759 RepID=UPI0004A72EAF|nr:bifunctional UDP-N-acetylglucosamine diphosphorylase/glucosamine-1-phosphate N-acetyltransferase GlmU [Desulfohalovibrio reitneri]
MLENSCALVLAAGKGTRMHSGDRPKVLAELLGRPMLWYVHRALAPVFEDRVHTVVGHGADLVAAAFPEHKDRFIHQAEQLGTGHALQVAWPRLKALGLRYVVVVNGDTPLLDTASVEKLTERAASSGAAVTFLTISPEGENAYGRVLRDESGAVLGIVEKRDFDQSKHGPEPREVNAGIYCLDMERVAPLLDWLGNSNKAREYYITDLVELAMADQEGVEAVECGSDEGLMGVNTPAELVLAEERLRESIVAGHAASGALIRNPAACRIGPEATIAPGADITGPCEITGQAVLARSCRVEPFCHVIESWLAEGSLVRSFSHLEQAEVGPGCVVGPYARLRTGSVLEEKAKVGNFVEMKKAVLGKGSKASHLTYLGDAEIGAGVNIGAGTITCNYDGRNKHRTVIRDGAFIGSNTALVAPVEIGADALVGAGSTITKNVSPGHLAVTRAKQAEVRKRK